MNSGIFSVGNDGAKEKPNILPKDAQNTDLSLSLYLPTCLIWRKFPENPEPQFPWDNILPFRAVDIRQREAWRSPGAQ